MERRPLKRLGVLIATGAVALMLIGCRGATGQTGAAGTNGTNGTDGTNGTNGTDGGSYLNANQLTTSEWAALTLKASITSVDVALGTPVVNFKVTDGKSNPIVGLGVAADDGTHPYFAFAIAKLVAGTAAAPTHWVNYNVVQTPVGDAAPTVGWPEPESNGTLKDNGNGSYTYTFALDITKAATYVEAGTYDATSLKADLGDLTYDGSLPHRLLISIGGKQADTTTLVGTPANLVYDFIPATGLATSSTDTTRNIVDLTSCNNCHGALSMHADYYPAIQKTDLCVVCHTDQMKFGSADSHPLTGSTALQANGKYYSTQKLDGRAIGDFPNMVHKIHMGEELGYSGYNQFMKFNEVTYPMDIRNCNVCHSATAITTSPVTPATPDGDNWMSKPSRLACGSCHDTVDFTTTHGGGQPAQADDQNCSGCHGTYAVQLYHKPMYPVADGTTFASASSARLNVAPIFSNPKNVPAGVKVPTWLLKSVQINSDNHPVFTFKCQIDGADVSFNDPTSAAEMVTGFIGSPSFMLSMGLPQDGIAAPVDFNYQTTIFIRNVWNGLGVTVQPPSKTVTVPTGTFNMTKDSDGYYSATITAITVPTGTAAPTMVIGGLGYSYSLGNLGAANQINPMTQVDLGAPYTYDATTGLGGVVVPVPNVWATALKADGTSYQARRSIIKDGACNACHENLGMFTASEFHLGQRNDGATCAVCHNPNGTGSGWSYNTKDMVHAIHAGSVRTNALTWHAEMKTWGITYPNKVNNCEACHVAGSYDLSTTSAAVPSMLWSTVVTGTPSATGVVLTDTSAYDSTLTYLSPWVTAGTVYGSGFTTNLISGSTTYGTTAAAGTTLVKSPLTAACSACHDSLSALSHMAQNGGSHYVARSTAITSPMLAANTESCLSCHGTGRTADIAVVHAN